MALPSAVRNLRGEFLTGTDRNTQKPLEDAWYTKNLKALLDAHYDVFKGTALNDIECMRETEHTKMKITKQRREDKSLPLPPVALRILGEWYDEKMAKLREEEGPEVVERDCKYKPARRAQTEELHGRHDNHDKDLAEIKAGVEKLIGLHESFYVEEEEAEEKAAKEAAAKEAAAKKAEEKAAKEAAAKEAAAKEAEEAAAKEAAAKEAAAKKAEEKATKEAAAKEAAAKKAEEKAAKEAAAKETAAKEAEEAAAKEAAAKEAAAKEAEEAAAKEAAEAEAKAAKEAAAKEAAAKEALSVEAENEESDELSKDEIERRLELLQVDWKKTRAEIDLHKEPTMEWKRLHHRLCDITDSKAALIRMQQRMLFKALKAQEEDEESRMNERLSHSWLAQDHMDLLDALDKDDVSIEGLRKLAWSFKNFKNTPRCRNPVEEKKELAEAKQ